MLRFLAAAACLALAGPAAAQDRPGQAGLNPPALAQPVAASPGAEAATPEPGSRSVLDSLALRHPEPEAAQTTSALKSPAEAPRPRCAQERRVGTGAGFCLIN
ncbi:hypothetical protein [Methylobacterium sp. NEAU K]|uniref:hypothetical protein n=1 Tax=Methylobacterium sp. NEAU K TaxID=3064946 RepID=UPI002734AFB7|nr:hypothetical protein [Methylobacterium sp. NEAU K]MDP4005537.1 hypothetical protein [Methylobacterium sp. NEAU K]